MKLPNRIACATPFPNGHVQGIAIDEQAGHAYFCFTTVLVKTDLSGRVLGTVGHLAGHMGCITIDPARRRLYGSLELKHDAIGKGIIQRNGQWDPSEEDSFYLVSFDIDKIDRMDMNAETDGVMKAVYLRDVVKDYTERDERCDLDHRYGCSGIDGIGLGPVFGADPDSAQKLMIAYGVYGQPEACGNDYQVILQFDPSVVDRYGTLLCQQSPHHEGPDACEARYFLYTGNTTYGIQNLEYDPFTRRWLVAVYVGKKPQFPNYPMYFIDATRSPRMEPLIDRAGECGAVLTLADGTEQSGALSGSSFSLGQTGVWARGDGRYWFSVPLHDRERGVYNSELVAYRYDPAAKDGFAQL